MSTAEIEFRAMGSEIRIVVGDPGLDRLPAPAEALASARAWIEDFDRRLSRFVPGSELCRLNADPRELVPASPLLRAVVAAGVWAAGRSGGLVDPTLVGALEDAGYRASRRDAAPVALAEALRAAPPRRAATPAAAGRWRAVRVDDALGVIERPPGLRLDTGGTGKGLAADALLLRLSGYGRVAVDCGGDIRVGGALAQREPFDVEIRHPLTHDVAMRIALAGGGIATSGLDVNVWRRAGGTFAHHLIDPGSGASAWTGLIGATALAPTALEAETLSKTALLLGPGAAARVLGEHGGIVIRDDGSAQAFGVLAGPAAVAA